MKILLCILTLLISGQLCVGQTKTVFVPVNKLGDTTLFYNSQQKMFKKAELKDLTKTDDTLHFRFSTTVQALDIWTTDYKTFRGKLTNFTTGYKKKRRDFKNERFYSEQINIDTDNAQKIYSLFRNYSILNLPPQDSIKGWGHGLDGITYFVEYSTPSYYSFKSYWTPYAYKDRVGGAKRFYELIKSLENYWGLRKSFNQFIHSLPKGTYRAGGLRLISTSNKKQKK